MKKYIQIVVLISLLANSDFLFSQEIEPDITLSSPETTSRTVEATNSITLLPGFSATGLTPFIARIVPENIYDVVKGAPYMKNEALNWISSSSYDLSGNLTSSGVAYFNTLGKATQNHSLDVKTGKIWTNEVRYDAFGKPTFSTLSAPVGTQYGYKNNFITTTTGGNLSKSQIESIKDNTAVGIIGNQENTLGWYYSENNTSEKYQDITAHPYSKVIYSRLRPGIPLKTLGGNKIQKTASSPKEWLQSYSFDMPMTQELFYEFEPGYFPERELVITKNSNGKAYYGTSDIYYTYDLQEVDESNCNGMGSVYSDKRLAENYTLHVGYIYKITLGSQMGYYKVISREPHYVSSGGGGFEFESSGGEEQLLPPPGGSSTELEEFIWLNDMEAYNCPLGKPVFLNGKKTVIRDVHGVESVVFTDTDGNVLAAARSGNEDGQKNVKTVISPINEQGYVDIHIPKGCGGTVSILHNKKYLGIPTSLEGAYVGGIRLNVYDLISEMKVKENISISSQPSFTLNPGVYRVELIDTPHIVAYEAPLPYVKLSGSTPALLDPINTIGIKYNVNYYDYSLNYYDKANRLVKSTQPLSKKIASTYAYNTLGQLQSASSPDEGEAAFKYRKDGQIRFSQNEQQALDGEFSYTNYDSFGRPVESGVAIGTYTTLNPDATSFSGTKKEQHFTVYDVADSNLQTVLTSAGLPVETYKQTFVAGNVAKTFTVNPSTTTTWYSYDAYGRVTWMVQNIDGLGVKTIDYEYDFAKGQLTKVLYQKHKANELFAHKYTYNIAGELYKVETSTDNNTFTEQAKYKYYETGALKRVEVAENVQGIDYIYNLNGQLKAINHPSRSNSLDPGKDGTNGIAGDLFGFAIDYYNGDYTRTNTPTPVTVATGFEANNQYNGNIKATRWSNEEGSTQASQVFTYNKNNWLQEANFGIANSTGTITPNAYGNYKVYGLSYDANGNIKTLNRNKNGDSSNAMDKLSYNYLKGKNQLDYITDALGNAGVNDIDTQSEGNYVYDSIGRLTENKKEKVTYEYNASGLVTKVFYDSKLKVQFFYNDKGHRVKKVDYLTTGAINKTTHYVRDASGSALAIYENLQQKEIPIYGASRLGVYNKGTNKSVYQLTDHLGNVRAVVEKQGTNVAAISRTDYYPFGMPMPERNDGASQYRYKYQGQEKDPETGKEAFQLRLWDGRIGRWLTTDPAGQYSSPYLGMGNNPISRVDPDGGTDCPNPPCNNNQNNNILLDEVVITAKANKYNSLVNKQFHLNQQIYELERQLARDAAIKDITGDLTKKGALKSVATKYLEAYSRLPKDKIKHLLDNPNKIRESVEKYFNDYIDYLDKGGLEKEAYFHLESINNKAHVALMYTKPIIAKTAGAINNGAKLNYKNTLRKLNNVKSQYNDITEQINSFDTTGILSGGFGGGFGGGGFGGGGATMGWK
ncbi:RHS repeat-associated core domain-containing protein [Tenacibaculum sp. FZY0031]|uniref:RHS repeat domain-containing protein n=1 Tax=Tenacibaculum sp. FZY0031 TaxID=3116648 RepID=UPI002EA4008A|nr:RHS repeat-associated core domain-containing protein [Tenacibaculum sp. FZY0031]